MNSIRRALALATATALTAGLLAVVTPTAAVAAPLSIESAKVLDLRFDGDLTDAGFDVVADPTPAMPEHVLVGYSGEWDDDVAERFDACFGPVPEEEK